MDCSSNSYVSVKSLRDFLYLSDNSNRKKKIHTKATQVNLEAWVSDDDLSSDIPTEKYWKVVAEKRRLALENALKENETMWKQYEALTQENAQNRKLLDEANTFMEVFKDLVQDTADDTGIDTANDSVTDN